jgi:hypothetical protein
MKRLAILAILAAVGVSGQNTLTKQEKKQGWILLFDGKSFAGWEDPTKRTPPGDAWTIEDGTIKTLRRAKITEDLFTTRTFGDFELAFDWRISEGGNSGIKYRIQHHLWLQHSKPLERFEHSVERSFAEPVTERPEKGQDYVIGFEYQMTDDAKNSDAVSNKKHTAGALYDMVAPSSAPSKPAGEWNQGRIVVRGKHVEHWLNGVKVVDATLDDPAVLEGVKRRWKDAPHVLDLLANQPKRECPISLQNHGDDAWFRNIKVRPLK